MFFTFQDFLCSVAKTPNKRWAGDIFDTLLKVKSEFAELRTRKKMEAEILSMPSSHPRSNFRREAFARSADKSTVEDMADLVVHR